MILKALENKKIASIFIEEGKSISALFGGFSLTLLTVPIGNPASTLEILSIFFSSLSSALLIILAYILTTASGLDRAKKHDSGSLLAEFADLGPRDLSAIGALVVASILIFLLNIVLVCFRVHWVAGLGGLAALAIPFLTGKYLNGLPR